MTPKQKAKELIENYKYRLLPFITFQTQLTEADLFNKCKQCALIAVDNIIASNPHSNPLNTELHSTMQYWMEVKQEINKL